MKFSSVRSRFAGICQRRLARWFSRRPFVIPSGKALVSFTFDDFPESAISMAEPILAAAGIRGTYYTSVGLAGTTGPTGKIFSATQLRPLVEAGHELGCHTFDHCPAWATPTADFVASVERNAAAVTKLLPGYKMATLSYPISYPRPPTKRWLQQRFTCCRGGGQTFNQGIVDLNYLSAFFLEQSREDPAAIRAIIDQNAQVGGWLILATHDVESQPTRFGITPELLRATAAWALESGAELLPVGAALDRLASRRASSSSQFSSSREPVGTGDSSPSRL